MCSLAFFREGIYNTGFSGKRSRKYYLEHVHYWFLAWNLDELMLLFSGPMPPSSEKLILLGFSKCLFNCVLVIMLIFPSVMYFMFILILSLG